MQTDNRQQSDRQITEKQTADRTQTDNIHTTGRMYTVRQTADSW